VTRKMKITPTTSDDMPVAVCTCLAMCVRWGEVETVTLNGMTGIFTLFFANCLSCLDTSSLIANEEYTVSSVVDCSLAPPCTMGLNVEAEVLRVLCVYPAGTNRASIISVIFCRAFRKTAAQLGFCSLFHCRGNMFVGSSSFYKYSFFKKERERGERGSECTCTNVCFLK